MEVERPPFPFLIDTIKRQAIVQKEQKQISLKRILDNLAEHFQLPIKTIEEKSDDLCELTFLTHVASTNNFAYLTHISLDRSKQSVLVVSTLSFSNGKTYLIQDHQIRLLFCRYVNRINNSQSSSKFSINPRNGEISLKSNLFFDRTTQEKFQDSPLTAHKTIMELYRNQLTILNYHTFRILIILEELPLIINKKSDVYLQSFEQIFHKLLKVKMMLTDPVLLKEFKVEMTDDTEKKYLDMPQNNTKEIPDSKILNEIEILEEPTHLEIINKGGFGVLERGKVVYKNNEGNKITKVFAIKKDRTDVQPPVKKVAHELKILSKLKDKQNMFIAKYYYSPKHDDVLFMEFYPSKSLELVKAQFTQTMSIVSKLYILWQVSMGLKFLSSMNIAHLDMKPANIVISKGYNARIIDFGEAYHQDVCKDQWRPGRTLPYTPYYDTNKDKNNNYKYCDIFSFGMILSEIIFDTYPVEFKRGALQKLAEKFQKGTYRGRLVKNYQRNFGPKHIIDLLHCLIFRCIDDLDKRPQIEYIILSIRILLNQIEKMYSNHIK